MGQSIREVLLKIKGSILSAKQEILVALIIVFVGLSSFGLGRLSVNEDRGGEVRILSQEAAVVAAKQGIGEDKGESKTDQVVASKTGKKYHYPHCAGAKQIAEKNKITFNSIEEARARGYTPAANCKGLN